MYWMADILIKVFLENAFLFKKYEIELRQLDIYLYNMMLL